MGRGIVMRSSRTPHQNRDARAVAQPETACYAPTMPSSDEPPPPPSHDPPGRRQLQSMLEGFEKAQLVSAAARLGIADALASGALDGARLAERLGLEPAPLRRVLRGWSGAACSSACRASASPCRRSVCTSGRTSSDRYITARSSSASWSTPPGVGWSTRCDGQVAFEHVFGRSFYDHLSASPAIASVFDRMMATASASSAETFADASDLSHTRVLVDVGGSEGRLVEAALGANPQLKGVVFDLPAVAERTRARLAGPRSRRGSA